MCCRCVWAGDECEGVCGVGVYGLGMSAEVSVVSVCMGWDECGGVCVWCRCVWPRDESGVSCVVGLYWLGMSAEVSECGVGVYGLGMSAKVSVVSVCMGWG